ncbi:hypothetical protein [Haloferula sp.]|uniref:hypothetical protein n=1 Tax=Haloferula sp. TaxID=2497595 RepID=UPI00329FA749
MKFAYLALFLAFPITSCLPQARTNQLTPVVRSSTQTGQPVTVSTKGGSDQAEMDGIGVTSGDFKDALESSLVSSGLFQQIGEGGYHLQAKIVDIDYPASAFSVVTKVEVSYTLQKGSAVVWRDQIRSSHQTQTGEAFLGEFRERMSTEKAVQANIRIAISAMSERLK